MPRVIRGHSTPSPRWRASWPPKQHVAACAGSTIRSKRRHRIFSAAAIATGSSSTATATSSTSAPMPRTQSPAVARSPRGIVTLRAVPRARGVDRRNRHRPAHRSRRNRSDRTAPMTRTTSWSAATRIVASRTRGCGRSTRASDRRKVGLPLHTEWIVEDHRDDTLRDIAPVLREAVVRLRKIHSWQLLESPPEATFRVPTRPPSRARRRNGRKTAWSSAMRNTRSSPRAGRQSRRASRRATSTSSSIDSHGRELSALRQRAPSRTASRVRR